MDKDSKTTLSHEKRAKTRKAQLNNYRVEIKLTGEPAYQLRVIDVSAEGTGLLVIEDSNFLDLIEVGQTLDADFTSPSGSEPSEMYKVEIKHISKPTKGKNKGHYLVGISLLEKIEPSWP